MYHTLLDLEKIQAIEAILYNTVQTQLDDNELDILLDSCLFVDGPESLHLIERCLLMYKNKQVVIPYVKRCLPCRPTTEQYKMIYKHYQIIYIELPYLLPLMVKTMVHLQRVPLEYLNSHYRLLLECIEVQDNLIDLQGLLDILKQLFQLSQHLDDITELILKLNQLLLESSTSIQLLKTVITNVIQLSLVENPIVISEFIQQLVNRKIEHNPHIHLELLIQLIDSIQKSNISIDCNAISLLDLILSDLSPMKVRSLIEQTLISIEIFFYFWDNYFQQIDSICQSSQLKFQIFFISCLDQTTSQHCALVINKLINNIIRNNNLQIIYSTFSLINHLSSIDTTNIIVQSISQQLINHIKLDRFSPNVRLVTLKLSIEYLSKHNNLNSLSNTYISKPTNTYQFIHNILILPATRSGVALMNITSIQLDLIKGLKKPERSQSIYHLLNLYNSIIGPTSNNELLHQSFHQFLVPLLDIYPIFISNKPPLRKGLKFQLDYINQETYPFISSILYTFLSVLFHLEQQQPQQSSNIDSNNNSNKNKKRQLSSSNETNGNISKKVKGDNNSERLHFLVDILKYPYLFRELSFFENLSKIYSEDLENHRIYAIKLAFILCNFSAENLLVHLIYIHQMIQDFHHQQSLEFIVELASELRTGTLLNAITLLFRDITNSTSKDIKELCIYLMDVLAHRLFSPYTTSQVSTTVDKTKEIKVNMMVYSVERNLLLDADYGPFIKSLVKCIFNELHGLVNGDSQSKWVDLDRYLLSQGYQLLRVFFKISEYYKQATPWLIDLILESMDTVSEKLLHVLVQIFHETTDQYLALFFCDLIKVIHYHLPVTVENRYMIPELYYIMLCKIYRSADVSLTSTIYQPITNHLFGIEFGPKTPSLLLHQIFFNLIESSYEKDHPGDQLPTIYKLSEAIKLFSSQIDQATEEHSKIPFRNDDVYNFMNSENYLKIIKMVLISCNVLISNVEFSHVSIGTDVNQTKNWKSTLVIYRLLSIVETLTNILLEKEESSVISQLLLKISQNLYEQFEKIKHVYLNTVCFNNPTHQNDNNVSYPITNNENSPHQYDLLIEKFRVFIVSLKKKGIISKPIYNQIKNIFKDIKLSEQEIFIEDQYYLSSSYFNPVHSSLIEYIQSDYLKPERLNRIREENLEDIISHLSELDLKNIMDQVSSITKTK
ncbi:heat shock factor (HSF)-type DNA-binding domain-containing protein [Tieghemostelium lacteum]|uniref:Heat shock factor (HSF)-type DNA-binding domain-containing protein n=1 Tax=Tieghemostelium lacteum TaxID=361077 RepID=A0A151Z767_TIELA|nr:heat shock factor (HSF)-type DNA-binding domain-containing protein [Tieghemostelium lacteum]|eukprot:KYQ89811.1 heat shock factor (HSF)-type DNA-binding domain-containing protein [Tieghemostelium lacteum]